MQAEYKWEERHAKIFHEYVMLLNREKIAYFILRNYEGLPEVNDSKDIDLIIKPGTYEKAAKLLLEVLKDNEVPNYYVVKFERVRCWIGIDTKSDFSIHIDLIEGYLNKGVEIFDFNTLYENTTFYKEYRVLNKNYDVIMLLLYKVIGCKELKEKYRAQISQAYMQNKTSIKTVLESVFKKKLVLEICSCLERENYDAIVSMANTLSKASKWNAFKKRPFYTLKNMLSFLSEKVYRIIACPSKYRKIIVVEAPDGAGKTTFIDLLTVKLAECFVTDVSKMHVYHFRPTLFPNLGEIGEKAGLMEQDKDFTNPHRGKKTSMLSSIIRIAYYSFDYVLGGFLCVRKDVQFDKFTIFDRYAYDFLVDPKRSKINLPFGVRKFFCKIVPQPQLTFVLNADAKVIYERKQELTIEEIERQLKEYDKLSGIVRGFHRLDANKTPQEIVSDAIEILIQRYTFETRDAKII